MVGYEGRGLALGFEVLDGEFVEEAGEGGGCGWGDGEVGEEVEEG